MSIPESLVEYQEELKNASILDLPSLIQKVELHDMESAEDLLNRVSADFQKEGIVDNVVTPVFATIIDSILCLKCFKGASRKLGLSAQRVMMECQSFTYDGINMHLMPESRIENLNSQELQSQWGNENRPDYVRSDYQDTAAMNRYRAERVKESGGRKNLYDEYRMTRDITEKKSNPDFRRNDPKNEYNAEVDHIQPLHRIFEQVQNNAALSKEDIKDIANADSNLALTARKVNNPKRDMTNSEFIESREKKNDNSLTPEVKSNMLSMEEMAEKAIEAGINETVSKNLLGKGNVDRAIAKEAIAKVEARLGRKLNKDESLAILQSESRKKALNIHKENAMAAGKRAGMYALGNAILFIIKPTYYEIKDSICNGFCSVVETESIKEAIKFRAGRIKSYVLEQLKSLKNLLGSAMDMVKNFLSSLIEGIIGMFVGILKKIFRVLKEGIKVAVQSWKIMFDATKSAAEKGDAIVKILGGSVISLVGIGIEALLEKFPAIPESMRGMVATLLSGMASIIMFYALDKADLFNAKESKRRQRIHEVFEERRKDIEAATRTFNNATNEFVTRQKELFVKHIGGIQTTFKSGNYTEIESALSSFAAFMHVELAYNNVDEFNASMEEGTLTFKM